MFINVPTSISKLQWHPFTITSSSNMDLDHPSVVIKCNGSWSQKLYQKLSSASPMDRIEVSIEGPYGPPSTQFLRCLHTFKAVPIFGLNMFYLKDSFHMVFKAVKIRLMYNC